jgi:hypothetical protein
MAAKMFGIDAAGCVIWTRIPSRLRARDDQP